MMRQLATTVSLSVGIFVMGCATAAMRLHDLTVDTKRKEAALKMYPHLREARTGIVFRVKQDLFLMRAGPPGRYYLDHDLSIDPLSKEEYYASPRKWPWIIGIVEAGTRIRGVHFEEYEPATLSSEVGWIGIVYEIVDGPHAGKLLAPMVPLFLRKEFLHPDPEFLEEVPAVKDIKQQESSK